MLYLRVVYFISNFRESLYQGTLLIFWVGKSLFLEMFGCPSRGEEKGKQERKQGETAAALVAGQWKGEGAGENTERTKKKYIFSDLSESWSSGGHPWHIKSKFNKMFITYIFDRKKKPPLYFLIPFKVLWCQAMHLPAMNLSGENHKHMMVMNIFSGSVWM